MNILKEISTYRSELMGWAILWIMALHFGFYDMKLLGFTAQYGYAGVDIFMFLSGFGLFFSFEKQPTLQQFYHRRLVRIFPTYYFIGLIYSFVILDDSICEYLFRYTTIGFWTNSMYGEWFIPSIMLLYIFAPIFKKIGSHTQGVVAIILLVMSYLLVSRSDLIDKEHYFLLYRIPAFLFGIICAQWLKSNKNIKWYYIILIGCIPLFIILYPQFHKIYMYKYLSILFLMPLFIYLLVLFSKYIKILNPILKKIGNASLEIYLTQWLFFVLIIDGVIARSDLNTIVLIVLCTLAGYLLHESMSNNRIFFLPTMFIYGLIVLSLWYAIKWVPILSPVRQHTSYNVVCTTDDTIRIAMYGDSWADMYPKQQQTRTLQGYPIDFTICGKGGLKSGEVYNLMFNQREPLLSAPQYCILIAGINDANANSGSIAYSINYQYMLRHLLNCGIKPVVIEIPDIDLSYVYSKKKMKDRLADVYRSFLTASSLNDVSGYRKRLRKDLYVTGLMDSILYIDKNLWNTNGYKDTSLYLTDRIHLNDNGYTKLDSCIIEAINRDLKTMNNFKSK